MNALVGDRVGRAGTRLRWCRWNRLYMNGPSKSDIEQRGKHFDWMECGIIFAGVLVVVGLLMESWPELKLAVSERRFPNVTVTGGIIVAVGVLLEVVLGIFITQRANRVQAEANERVAKAEQATAEANLARVKLQTTLHRRTLRRYLDTEEEKELAEALSGFAWPNIHRSGSQIRTRIGFAR
jgi:hypothetical protein